jgi:hypothetical protein
MKGECHPLLTRNVTVSSTTPAPFHTKYPVHVALRVLQGVGPSYQERARQPSILVGRKRPFLWGEEFPARAQGILCWGNQSLGASRVRFASKPVRTIFKRLHSPAYNNFRTCLNWTRPVECIHFH